MKATSRQNDKLEQLVDEVTYRLAAGHTIDLDALARDHPEHADELDSLLPAIKGMNSLRQALHSPPSPIGRLPPTVGDFRLLREIGHGGMGVVYEAEQISLNRHVALKILPPSATLDKRQLTRFQNEARAAAQLQHPHIVPVIEFGSEGGVYYYAMQYIEGQPLSKLLEELRNQKDQGKAQGKCIARPLLAQSEPALIGDSAAVPQAESSTHRFETDTPPAELIATKSPVAVPTDLSENIATAPSPQRLADWGADDRQRCYRAVAELGIQAAEALGYAHQHGVVHRDIKPANLMLDEAKQLWITDFGLAHCESSATLTMSGEVLGTLRYMSPEQASGQQSAVDERTDVYSLGATLYELLTLEPVFGRSKRSDLLRQIAEDEPRPPRQLAPDLPRDLETIVLKTLEKRPADRYATARKLAHDLRAFLDDRPIEAKPSTLITRATKWSRRHREMVFVGAAFSALLIAGVLGGGVWHIARLSQELAVSNQLRVDLEARERQQQRAQYVSDIQLCQRLWREGKLAQTQHLLVNYLPTPGGEDLRDFAWYYLWQRCHSELTTYRGHVEDVSAVAYSPDGRRVATAGHDGTARLFDTQSGDQLALMEGHQGEVNCVAFTPDGQTLATGGDDGTVRLWEATTGRLLATLLGHKEDVLCLTISPDGKLLASGGLDKIVHLWDLKQRKQVGTLEGHADWVRGLAFSPDGRALASGSEDGKIGVWDVAQRSELRQMIYASDWVLSVAFGPRGERLAAGQRDRRVSFWNAKTGDLNYAYAKTFRHDESVRSVAISGDGKYLAAVETRRPTKLWSLENLDDPQLERKIPGHAERTMCVTFAPDSRTMVTAGGDGVAKRWRVGDDPYWDEYWETPDSTGTSGGLTASHDGRMVAWPITKSDGQKGTGGGGLRVWNPWHREGMVAIGDESTLEEIGFAVRAVAFSNDGRQLAFVGPETCPHVVCMDAPSIVCRLSGPLGAEHGDVAFHPLGEILAISNESGTIWLWNLTENVSDEITLTTAEHASIRRVLFSPDGNTLAAHDENRQVVMLYDMQLKRVRASLPHCAGDLSFSPDSQLLATGATDRTLVIWNVLKAQVVRTLSGSNEFIRYVRFSPAGKVLATVVGKGPIAIWSVESGEQLLEIPTPFSDVNFLAFAPDGKSLLLGGYRPVSHGGREAFESGVAFYSAGDPLLHGEKFRFRVQ